ncbi:hypothetical protein ABW21_db0209904 [Orbilia brochopaga]|nr:hypothetical protein ABW21_db0209904 [Drechslerella brochopaga]
MATSAAPVPMDEDAAIASFLENPDQLDEFLKEGGSGNQEKADDAIDFGDISDDDDDLPDEEEPVATTCQQRAGTADSDGSLMDLAAEGLPAASGSPEADPNVMDVDEDLFGDAALEDLFGNNNSSKAEELEAITTLENNKLLSDAVHSMFREVDFQSGSESGPSIAVLEPEEEKQPELTVFDYFPLFQEHAILPYLSMFPPKPAYYPMRPDKQPKVLFPTKLNLDLARGTTSTWRSNDYKATRKPGMIYIDDESDSEPEPVATQEEKEQHDKKDAKIQRNIEMATTSWDIDALDREQPRRRRKAPFDDEEAENSAKDPHKKIKAILDLNDPFLLVDVRKSDDMRRVRRIGGEFIRQRINKDLTQRYNISNDEAYDLLKENHQSKVRSTIGNLEIEHTMPAVRLQTPYYKTQLQKPEMRSFHRPRLTFPVETELRFTKGKTLKRKHFKGNRVINYYRRKEDSDETRPKCELGELQVLMSQDKSPFWNFGSIEPGEMVPALYNRMIRAPIFKHSPKSTDFVVVRNTDSGGAYYYLRTIPHLFTVGQTFPVTDVPGPHSRKVTTASKNRMKMITYRVIRKKGNRIAVKDISPHFPENTEIQTRQKMKEFMSHQNEKESEKGGYWYLKGADTIPEEFTIRTMVTPESVCLLDAMQVGGRYLEDAGYGKAADAGDEDEKEGMSTEEKLAPWIATKNFINATQGKAMLQLHGEGDPTSRGEAFSFIKTSMKGGFKAIGESVDEKLDAATLKALGGHSYNVARQQKAYEETIEKIWRAQEASLKSEEVPELDPDELQDATQEDVPYDDGRTPYSEGMTPATGAANTTIDDETTSQFSRFSARNTGNKVMRITRQHRREDGTIEKQTEMITDPKVIAMRDITNLKPTGDPIADANKKAVLSTELARLLRNKERRQARERQNEKKRKQLGIEDDGTPKGGTTRKCANCGMVGHIKTNKKMCPMLNGTMAAKNAAGGGADGSTTPKTPTPA